MHNKLICLFFVVVLTTLTFIEPVFAGGGNRGGWGGHRGPVLRFFHNRRPIRHFFKHRRPIRRTIRWFHENRPIRRFIRNRIHCHGRRIEAPEPCQTIEAPKAVQVIELIEAPSCS